jgi:hypothetical protein
MPFCLICPFSMRLELNASDRYRARPSSRGATMTTIRNVVLVHGGFVDGSGWQGVYDDLSNNGFPHSGRAETGAVAGR